MTTHVTGHLRAILLAMVAMALFATLDATAKFVTHSLPVPVAVFFRYAIALLLSGSLLWKAGGPSFLATRHPGLHLVRGLLLLASTMGNFTAMQYLQLAQTGAIFFTIPLWVCALSVPLLGEHVGIRRWAAVLVGFCGVLVIMRPGSAGFHWAMLLALGNAMLGALYNIATRKVRSDPAETSLFYLSLFGSLGAVLPALHVWQTPIDWQWLLLVILGVAGASGHFAIIAAHRLANATVLAPFTYTQIIWMTLFGYVLFGNVPDGYTLLGAVIVVASSIYIFARERAHGQTGALPTAED